MLAIAVPDSMNLRVTLLHFAFSAYDVAEQFFFFFCLYFFDDDFRSTTVIEMTNFLSEGFPVILAALLIEGVVRILSFIFCK